MTDRDIRISQMATRIRDFGALQSASFPTTSLGGQKFAAFHALVEEIDTHGSKQVLSRGSAQASTGAKKELREAIRAQMKAVRDTSLALEAEQAGVSQSFRMPQTNGDESLINSARAFVEAATPLKTQFTSREMPSTFLEDLTATVAQFEESVTNHNQQRATRTAATASLKDALAQILDLRRELDPIVRNKFRDDPAKLAMWESSSHLERAPKKAAPATQITPTP